MAVFSERPSPGSSQYPAGAAGPATPSLIESVVDAGATLVQVVGSLDPALAAELEAAIGRAAPEHAVLVIGLDECEWIDPAGVAVLERVWARLDESGRVLYLCAPEDQPLQALQANGLAGDGLLIESLEDVLG